MLFGLLMALTFVGAVSAAADRAHEQIQTLFTTSLGCNLAWGLVDAVMYLVRTITERGRLISLVGAVRKRARTPKPIGSSSSNRCPRVAAGLFRRRRSKRRHAIIALPALPGTPQVDLGRTPSPR
jgi:hypothetical protein